MAWRQAWEESKGSRGASLGVPRARLELKVAKWNRQEFKFSRTTKESHGTILIKKVSGARCLHLKNIIILATVVTESLKEGEGAERGGVQGFRPSASEAACDQPRWVGAARESL